MPDIEAPEITAANIQQLLDSPAEEPVLYIKLDEDDGTPGDLDVWAAAYAPRHAVVLTRSEVEDALGAEPTGEDIREHLPVWQEDVERVFGEIDV